MLETAYKRGQPTMLDLFFAMLAFASPMQSGDNRGFSPLFLIVIIVLAFLLPGKRGAMIRGITMFGTTMTITDYNAVIPITKTTGAKITWLTR